MNLTRGEAETALRDVGRTHEHSLLLFGYGLASPHLLLWGVLWVIAGTVGAVSPDTAGIAWLIVDTVGISASGYLVVRSARRYSGERIRIQGLRYAATIVVLAAFVAMTLMIFAPVSGAEVQLFITMLIAAIYMIAGIWIGRRFAVVGAMLATLAAGAFRLAPAHLPLIVSILGGGALILGGLWMRRIW